MRLLCILLALLFGLFPAVASGGGSWSCDGTSDGYAEFDHNSAYNSATFSVTMWLRQGVSGVSFPAIISRNNEAASVGWNWYVQVLNNELIEAGWNDNKTGNSNLANAFNDLVLEDGKWYRVQYRLRDETNRYVDVTVMGYPWDASSGDTQTNPTDFTAAPIQLCRLSVSGTYRYNFEGELSHVEVFDKWLTNGEMLFNYWHPGMMTANQVMNLPLTGTSIDDISSTNNDPSTTGTGMSDEDSGPPLGWHGGLGF